MATSKQPFTVYRVNDRNGKAVYTGMTVESIAARASKAKYQANTITGRPSSLMDDYIYSADPRDVNYQEVSTHSTRRACRRAERKTMSKLRTHRSDGGMNTQY